MDRVVIARNEELLGSKKSTLKGKFHSPIPGTDAEVTMIVTPIVQLMRVWLTNDLHVAAVNGALPNDIR